MWEKLCNSALFIKNKIVHNYKTHTEPLEGLGKVCLGKYTGCAKASRSSAPYVFLVHEIESFRLWGFRDQLCPQAFPRNQGEPSQTKSCHQDWEEAFSSEMGNTLLKRQVGKLSLPDGRTPITAHPWAKICNSSVCKWEARSWSQMCVNSICNCATEFCGGKWESRSCNKG